MNEIFSSFDFLQWMDADVRQAFTETARVRHYQPGQVIYMQDDIGTEMFRLVSGSVRMVVNRSDGKEIVYTLFRPGDCFGDSSLIDDHPRPQTAEARTDVILEVLDRPGFDRLRMQYRNFDEALLRLLACQMRYISTYFADASLSSLPARIARRIAAAASSAASNDTKETRQLSVMLSQSELAAMVGASRQSVNKVLQSFQSEGLLRIEYGNLFIVDLQGLSTRAAQAD